MADSSPGDRGWGQGGLKTGARGGLGGRSTYTGPQKWGSPAQGCHLPDGDFKDLIEFALQQ